MSAKPDAPRPAAKDAARLLGVLRVTDETRHKVVPGRALEPELALLREWQSQRLQRTYADLLEDERYAPAYRFFLSDIYGPRDFSQRDHDLERLHGLLARVLPAAMLVTLSSAIELNRLTRTLDDALLAVLIDPLGMTDTLTEAMYAEGYRLCNNYAERLRQIDLVADVIANVGASVHVRLAGLTLRAARVPAHAAGWHELQDFLERGFEAFKRLPDDDSFVETIRARELGILDALLPPPAGG